MKLKQLDGNLINFKEEFIIAGPRRNVLSAYKELLRLGAEKVDRVSDRMKINSGDKLVILCRNEGRLRTYGKVQVLTRSWWDYYHNRKKHCRTSIKTYNAWNQQDKIIENLNIEAVPLLIPEYL